VRVRKETVDWIDEDGLSLEARRVKKSVDWIDTKRRNLSLGRQQLTRRIVDRIDVVND